MHQQNVIVFSSGKNKRGAHEIARGLDCGVCRAVVWDEFFGKIYDIKADDAIEKDHLSRLLAKEIDLFRNTLAQFLLSGKDGACYVTASDAEAGFNRIFTDEMVTDVLWK